jgi:hypothetical protein
VTDLLEWIGGQAAFEALRHWYTTSEEKPEYQYTRFRA